jgi:hypothetical protein
MMFMEKIQKKKKRTKGKSVSTLNSISKRIQGLKEIF